MRRLGNRPDALIEALHSTQEAFGYIDDRRPATTSARPSRCRLRRSSASRRSTTTSRSSRRASTPAWCAPGPRATSTAPIGDPRRRSAETLGDQARQTHGRRPALAADRPAASGSCSLAPAAIVDGEVQGRVKRGRVSSKGWSDHDRRRQRPGRAHRRRRRTEPIVPTGRSAPPPTSARRSAACRPAPTRSSSGLGEQIADAGLTDVAVKRVGCLGLCAAGPLVQIPETGQVFEPCPPGRRSAPSSTRSRSHHAGRDAPGDRGALLRPPGPDRDGELGPGRSGEPRGLRRAGGYEALRKRVSTMTPGRGPRRDRQASGSARPRRRRLPDRPQVEHRRQGRGLAEVRHLQRRRGRPRRVHGPQRPGERPAPRPRGDGHRRLRGRRQRRATSTAGPSTRSP